jgi:hypothetical protein
VKRWAEKSVPEEYLKVARYEVPGNGAEDGSVLKGRSKNSALGLASVREHKWPSIVPSASGTGSPLKNATRHFVPGYFQMSLPSSPRRCSKREAGLRATADKPGRAKSDSQTLSGSKNEKPPAQKRRSQTRYNRHQTTSIARSRANAIGAATRAVRRQNLLPFQ